MALLLAAGCCIPAVDTAQALPEFLQHEGYVCADVEGARAIAKEIMSGDQSYDTAWDIVDAVRAEGYDCTHTLSGPVKMKVMADVETIAGTKDPPLHIVEASNVRSKATVFIISPLE